MRGRSEAGFTLIELLVVIGLMAILFGIAGGVMSDQFRRWSLRNAANRVLEDMRAAQMEAIKAGDYQSVPAATGEQFIQQNVFVVFDPAANSYRAELWVDDDGDGNPEATDNNGYPDAADSFTTLLENSLPNGFSFNSGPATTSACSGSSAINPVGSDDVTFSRPNYPPCNGKPCIRFDGRGKVSSVGNIYITDGRRTYAVNSLRPGFFRLCMSDGGNWR
ncbi:prepilin-type N-terminal cleavage/methylation domain-containing protein [Geothermobacter ehrlichii]|uniref:Prepilin-type N-terminal cleavage/methylation domain-containing protein n=1 Tax=Geothermobacter ehrlichii TaxID=213224 RepID=A0A5D3WNM1_9BACT|nr:prepilin-type N-terminal cleavage/methylation domain-containing protein [Geothermobacter ehrlichii]TYO99933.1 prepilin-type N-terminal cleavage/methylation domain-containing protein [Geothermobacter ehrlichii]